jgi:hypothetical protein
MRRSALLLVLVLARAKIPYFPAEVQSFREKRLRENEMAASQPLPVRTGERKTQPDQREKRPGGLSGEYVLRVDWRRESYRNPTFSIFAKYCALPL